MTHKKGLFYYSRFLAQFKCVFMFQEWSCNVAHISTPHNVQIPCTSSPLSYCTCNSWVDTVLSLTIMACLHCIVTTVYVSCIISFDLFIYYGGTSWPIFCVQFLFHCHIPSWAIGQKCAKQCHKSLKKVFSNFLSAQKFLHLKP